MSFGRFAPLMLLVGLMPADTNAEEPPATLPSVVVVGDQIPEPQIPEPQTARPETPEQIQAAAPAFYVRAALNRPDGIYYDGDAVSLDVICEREAFVYVLYRQVDNKVYQIFPNSAHPDNRVPAKIPVKLGAEGDVFRWRVVAPFGKESITVIASQDPIDDLAKKEHVARQFNPVNDETLKGITVDILGADPKTWATTQIQLEARPRPQSPPVANVPRDPSSPNGPARRIGLFVGVSKHMFNDDALAAQKRFNFGIEQTSDIDGPASGATAFAEEMRTGGALNETRVLTDDQATRSAVEAAMTEWLPSVSQPGDTVFLFYSGHSIKIPDDNGDEQDGQDELIMLHDTINGLHVLVELILRNADTDLPPEKLSRVAKMLALIGDRFPLKTPPTEDMTPIKRAFAILDEATGTNDHQTLNNINLMLLRESGVSDDLFGAWMQKLEGRKVVIVLDTCYAGGHSNNEKSVTDSDAAPIDFLDSEATRLKDIGQRDLALLASASVLQAARVMPAAVEKLQLPRMGVFTAIVINTLRHSSGPLTVESLFDEVKKAFDLARAEDPNVTQAPVLFNDLTDKIYFKP